MKPSENLENDSLISHIPWTKTEVWSIAKDLPKVTNTLTDLLRNLKQSFKLSLSYSFQLVHILVSEGQAQCWMKTTIGKILKGLQNYNQEASLLIHCMTRFKQLVGDFIKQLLGFYQSLLIGTKFRLATQNLMNLVMTAIINCTDCCFK